MISKQVLFPQLKATKLFDLIQQSKWQDAKEFVLHKSEGKEEAKSIGIELLYTAVQYRAPVGLMILLFDLIESETGRKITLNSTLLCKAMYHPTASNDTNWENTERMNVATFLSEKIQQIAH